MSQISQEQIQRISEILQASQQLPGMGGEPVDIPSGFSTVAKTVLNAGEGPADRALRERLAQLSTEKAVGLETLRGQAKIDAINARAQASINQKLAERRYTQLAVADLAKAAQYALNEGQAVRVGPAISNIVSQIRSLEGAESFTAKGIESQIDANRSRMVAEVVNELMPAFEAAGVPVDEAVVESVRKQLDTQIAGGFDRGTARGEAQKSLGQRLAEMKKAASAEADKADLIKKYGKELGYENVMRQVSQAEGLPETVRKPAIEQSLKRAAGAQTLKRWGGGAAAGLAATLLASKLFGRDESASSAKPDEQLRQLATIMAMKKAAGGGGEGQGDDGGKQLLQVSRLLGIIKTLQGMGGMMGAGQAPPSLAQMI